jgi:hypothetical protein
MTYTAGGLIEATDYNGFANNTGGANVNSVWSTGSNDLGYGQTALATVSAGGTVTAVQWANLNNRIASMAQHQGTTITSRTNPVATDLITIQNAINTDLTNCTTNRGNAVASGTTSSTWSGFTSKTSGTGSGTSSWTITFTHTVNFNTADQARYFWNAGGLVRLDMNKTQTGTDSDPDWNTFVSTVGTLVMSGRVNSTAQTIAGTSYTGFTRIGGSGTPGIFLSTTGWYSLAPGAGASTMFQINSSVGPYSGNFIRVTAARNAGSTALTFVTTWSSAGSSGPGTSANISGGSETASPFSFFGSGPAVVCRFVPPSTTFLTASWGTPTVTASVA